ncbi:hypothetical protein P4O66_004716 [Electrophorus voltai]|uniref:Uncharacterized protein n=1 Tax=Electrophorus voltai TaxID=2609070 RepID=A0AAD9DZ38_9TELE|nr:hypothetical protein P4O66_004716 [Electrophorus voltai]
MDSAGFYDPCMDYLEGCAVYGERGEYCDVGLRSEMGSDHEEDPLVEEVPHGDPSSKSDITASKDDEPPAPKALPKALPRVHRPEVSKLPWLTGREVASSSEEDTPLPKSFYIFGILI